jgi:cell division septation protein DedD
VNRSYESDDDLQDAGPRDREISLGTTTIIGIFFALALLCALFFGFGYSMGRRSTQTITGAAAIAATNDTSDAKPAPGSPASGAAAASRGNNEAADEDANSRTSDSAASSTATVANVSPATPTARPQPSRLEPSAEPTANPAIKPVSLPRPGASAVVPPTPVAIPGMGLAVVQVAAVSHQEDADMLMRALKKHGYNVSIRQEPQDKLLHVQVGPFANKKDAEAMRQRLLTDGYNAIVK